MANPTPITEADLETVDQFLQDMKATASKYHDAGNPVMLGIIADILKDISREVTRLHARYERESLAAINRDHRTLRKAQRNGASPSA